MNAVLDHIKAVVASIGAEQAAIHFSGGGPGKKITPAQLDRVIAGEEMPVRVALQVCEDFAAELERTRQVADGRRIEADHLRAETVNLASDNANLLARLRQADSEAIARASMPVAPQVAQSFVPPVLIEPRLRQPWEPETEQEREVQVVQPWNLTTRAGLPVRAENPYQES